MSVVNSTPAVAQISRPASLASNASDAGREI
jgi:hypothetical protein